MEKESKVEIKRDLNSEDGGKRIKNSNTPPPQTKNSEIKKMLKDLYENTNIIIC